MIPARNTLAFWHILAITTITFWGTSFVSTKVLLNHGFSAVQIFTLRFAVTYLILLAASHSKFRTENWKHEIILFICGITGCTLYFWTENTALSLSPSSNVALIVCTNPLLIMILGGIFYKSERLSKRQILGCLVTFIGMVLVVLNGKYNTLFITRRMFFYGTLTSIPALFIEAGGSASKALDIPWQNFAEPVVSLNFLCLTVFSSLFGYLVWNKVLKQLGTVLASNYGYALPMVTMITAVIALGEHITLVAIAGAVAIIAGMVLAEWER